MTQASFAIPIARSRDSRFHVGSGLTVRLSVRNDVLEPEIFQDSDRYDGPPHRFNRLEPQLGLNYQESSRFRQGPRFANRRLDAVIAPRRLNCLLLRRLLQRRLIQLVV